MRPAMAKLPAAAGALAKEVGKAAEENLSKVAGWDHLPLLSAASM
jgi:hypothetical protein